MGVIFHFHFDSEMIVNPLYTKAPPDRHDNEEKLGKLSFDEWYKMIRYIKSMSDNWKMGPKKKELLLYTVDCAVPILSYFIGEKCVPRTENNLVCEETNAQHKRCQIVKYKIKNARHVDVEHSHNSLVIT